MSTAIIQTRINLFKAQLQAGQYDIDAGFEAFILECIKGAELDKAEIITKPGNAEISPAPVALKTKQLNCYNVFMQEKMAEFSVAGMPGKDKVGKVAEAWALLSEADKTAYKLKAKESTPVAVHSKPNPAKKGPKGLTGWQLYVQLKMPEVKADASVLAKERLGKIGSLWKALTKPQQEEYVAQAKLTHDAVKSE